MPTRGRTRKTPAPQLSENISTAEVSNTAEASPNKDSIRGRIGLFYVRAFVIIIGGVLFFTVYSCYKVSDIKDLLLAISGVLSGPLGFIIGFYFKEELQKNNI